MTELRKLLIKEASRAFHSEACDGQRAYVGALNAEAAVDAILPIIAQHVEAAVAAEREACAKVADNAADVECCGRPRITQTGRNEFWEECCRSPNVSPWHPDRIAAVIRERAQK